MSEARAIGRICALLAVFWAGGVRAAEEGIQVALSASKANPFVHEQVALTVRVAYPAAYTMTGCVLDVNIPDALVQRKVGGGPELETGNGETGREALIYRKVVLSGAPGEFSIGPAQVTLPEVLALREKAANVKSEPVRLDVRPLPAGAPPDFRGFVGTPELKVQLNTRALTGGGLLNVSVHLRADCDPTLDLERQLVFPGFDAFTQVGKTVSARSTEFVKDRLITTWRLARTYRAISGDGEADVGVSLAYLDPGSGRYHTRAEGPFRVVYSGGTGGLLRPPAAPVGAPEAGKAPAEERPGGASDRIQRALSGETKIIIAGSVVLLLIVLTGILVALRRRTGGFPAQVRLHLDAAGRQLGDADAAPYLASLGKAIREALCARFQIGPYGPTETAVREMEKAGAPAELVGRVQEILRACADRGLDSRGGKGRQKRRLLARVGRLIKDLLDLPRTSRG